MKQLNVNDKNYTILKLLGKGKGGYSYLALDQDKQVVLKQIHHEPCDYYQFGNKIESELNDYHKLKEIGIMMPQLLEVDIQNERIIKEYIDGPTVFEMVLHDSLPLNCNKQIQKMCSLVYKAHINIDYFPTNFVLEKHTNKLYYIDYECNPYMDKWNFENWGIQYWSKTPEFLKYVKVNAF